MQTPNTELCNSFKKHWYIIASGFFIAFSGAIILCNANTLSENVPHETAFGKKMGYAMLALGMSMTILTSGSILWVQKRESIKNFFSSCLEHRNNESHPLIP